MCQRYVLISSHTSFEKFLWIGINPRGLGVLEVAARPAPLGTSKKSLFLSPKLRRDGLLLRSLSAGESDLNGVDTPLLPILILSFPEEDA